jgi:hypothetical protein
MRPIQPLVRLPHSYIDPNGLSADPFTYPQKISVRTTRATAITRPRSGPVGDLAGLDIGWHARREWPGRPDDPRFYHVSDLLAEQGRLGRKSGVGFYRYEPAVRRGKPDPEVVELVKAEAARILGEGIARSPADIGVIWCNGYGYPRERRGRMFYAAGVGYEDILRRLGARLMPFTKLAFGRPLNGWWIKRKGRRMSASIGSPRQAGPLRFCDFSRLIAQTDSSSPHRRCAVGSLPRG